MTSGGEPSANHRRDSVIRRPIDTRLRRTTFSTTSVDLGGIQGRF